MNEVNWLSKILDMYPFNIFLIMILSLNFLLTNCEHFSLLFLGAVLLFSIRLNAYLIYKNIFISEFM